MKRASPPATKEDVRMLMDHIGGFYDKADGRLRSLEDQVKELRTEAAASEERVIRHFDVAVEQIRQDLLGATRDKLVALEERVARIEDAIGFRSY
jgi:hypothetical protein